MNYAEAYYGYAAQGIPQIDVEIVKKSHFWLETSYAPALSAVRSSGKPSLNYS